MLPLHQRVERAPFKAFGLLVALGFALSAAINPSLPVSAHRNPSEDGRFLYSYMGCIDCHGSNGEGDVGPQISALEMSFEDFLTQMRTPRDQMDPYPPELMSDGQAADLYTFLLSLQR